VSVKPASYLIYHKRGETIRGHVFRSLLALLLKQELESRLRRADLPIQGAMAAV
jgi:hypothetical protein